MSNARSLKILVKALLPVLLLVGLATGIRLFHLGPLSIRPGDEPVLAQLALTNGSSLVVVARRNESLVEAYTVNLYWITSDGRTARYLLAFEDSYWWACSLRLSRDGHEVEVRADGQLAARFSVDKGSVIWRDHLPPQHGEWDQSGHVQKLLAAMKH